MNYLIVSKCLVFGSMSACGMNIFDNCLLNRLAFSILEMAKRPSRSVQGDICFFFILSIFLAVLQKEQSVRFKGKYLFSKSSDLCFNFF